MGLFLWKKMKILTAFTVVRKQMGINLENEIQLEIQTNRKCSSTDLFLFSSTKFFVLHGLS